MGIKKRVEGAKATNYKTIPVEPYRSRKKGKKPRTWHSHSFYVGDEKYSFLALEGKRWFFITDTISFEWEWCDKEIYRNVIPETIKVVDKDGKPIKRGDHGSKPWRSGLGRLPGRQND